MKVICIDSKAEVSDHTTGLLQEGKAYTVVFEGEATDVYGRPSACYVLAEIGFPYAFDKKRFAPISDIDETEFERTYNKELQPK